MREVGAIQRVCLVVLLATVLMLFAFPLVASAAGATLTSEQAAAWVEDLEYFAEQLPRLHYNAFNSISESEFNARVELLKAQIPGLSEDVVVIGISRLASLVRDSHTGLSICELDTAYFPLEFSYFVGEGPRILATLPEYGKALFAEPTKINGVPFKEIEALLDEAFYSDNAMGAIKQYPQLMVNASILDGLNITDGSDSAVWSFLKDGEEFGLELPVIAGDEYFDWVTVFAGGSPTPMYRRQVDNPYYYIWNPDLKLLYFAYNSCVERSDLSFDDFTYMLMDAVQEYPFERFVIDLRNNGGGNSGILDPLIELLADSEKVNRQGVLFVITGRRTYSSAVLNAISLRQFTEAVFVGEPTGAKPNFFGEMLHFTLPNSQLGVSYSISYFGWSRDTRDALYPDIKVYLSLDEFVNGHDPALAAILAY